MIPPTRRKYGTRRPKVASGSDAIFGSTSTSAAVSTQTSDQILDDITSTINNLQLDEQVEYSSPRQLRKDQRRARSRRVIEEEPESENEDAESHEGSPPPGVADAKVVDDSVSESESESEDEEDHETVDDTIPQDEEPDDEASGHYGNEVPIHLQPLADAYKADRSNPLYITSWSAVLPTPSTITKIAEASYAEVYRISSPAGTSIIKVMQVKVPSDPLSLEIETAIEASTLVSEIRIMNALTVLPGFVVFKDAHLVKGMYAPEMTEAYWQFLEDREDSSFFPEPEECYGDESMFLVLELGDAGTVLEDYSITSVDEIWDVFLGTAIALMRAEETNEFEHRDLHENNICVQKVDQQAGGSPLAPSNINHTPSPLKLGHSCLEITIIDYGLSRATADNGDIIYQDLEEDLGLFQSKGTEPLSVMQFDNYRRMRSHLLDGGRSMQPIPWHNEASRGEFGDRSWEEYIPYTNVLWLRYLLSYLMKSYKKSEDAANTTNNKSSKGSKGSKKAKKVEDSPLVSFEEEISELKKRLNVRTKVENGAFSRAWDIVAYAVEMGWVNEDQVMGHGVDTSVLTEGG